MKYRISIETHETPDMGWDADWSYEVGPCRGGPCGQVTGWKTERDALEAAFRRIIEDTDRDPGKPWWETTRHV